MTTHNNNIIVLPDELNIKNVGSVKSQLDIALEQGNPLTLDSAKLKEIDTAGMQLLVSFFKHCKSNSVALSCGEFAKSIYQFSATIGIDRAHLAS